MKHIREIAAILVFAIAGVTLSLQAQDESKKPAAPSAKKSECCSKMKAKGEGKMSCCSSDSTGTKDAPPPSGKK